MLYSKNLKYDKERIININILFQLLFAGVAREVLKFLLLLLKSNIYVYVHTYCKLNSLR